jgi:hypothetical protein
MRWRVLYWREDADPKADPSPPPPHPSSAWPPLRSGPPPRAAPPPPPTSASAPPWSHVLHRLLLPQAVLLLKK